MAAIKKDNDSLSILTAAALALPGMAAYASDPNVRGDNIALSYYHADYTEEQGRMHVKTDQLSLTAPLGARYEVKLNAIRDVPSGASIFSNTVVNGQVMHLLSRATIREQRNVVEITGGYYGDAHYADICIGKSIENDYKANFISTNYRRYFNDKTTTLTLGADFSEDTTWEKFYPRPGARQSPYNERRKHDLAVGLSQIMDANSVASISISHGYSYGYLGDQYRKPVIVLPNPPFISFGTPDTRPNDHTQWIALARYSHFFAGTQSALHLDYRFALDSWDTDSHTLEAKWRWQFGSGWSIAPGLRYYTQKSAYFYDLYFTRRPDDGFISTDYRLAGFGAVSPKLELIKRFSNTVSLRASVEKYFRKRSYRLSSGSRGDAIDDYNAKLLSVSIDGAF